MDEERYTLEELADLTRLKPRTIRHYIQKDLLLGPETLGRKASYGEYHLKRLQVIRQLRDNGFTIKQIVDYFRHARPDEEIRVLGLPMEEPEIVRLESSLQDMEITPEPESDSTIDFIRARQSEAASEIHENRIPASAKNSQPPPSIGPIELLLERLRNLSGTQRISRRSRGEDWTRMTVTPDLELHVRGPMPPEELELFEQVADQIRVILLGGDNA